MKAVVIASANGDVGILDAMHVLRNGGSATDAVIAGARKVEANPDDHSVGYSGLPNLLGDVELDASIMEGKGLRAGGVGALKGYQDALDLARLVMDETPHALLGGEGAARFAAESGMSPKNLLTPEAERIWRSRLEESDDVSSEKSVYYDKVRSMVGHLTSDPELPEPPHGTVNFIALDRDGNLATGVTTSGWAWKYPGRMGDSPIVGAGNYADNDFGAAACTGRGEMTQRAVTAHSIVTFMRFGLSLEQSLTMAMEDLRRLDDPYASVVHSLAMDPEGNHAAASTSDTKTYISMREDQEHFEELPRMHVPLVALP